MPEYENNYHHCGEYWMEYADSMCNDHCPVCGKEIEPFESIEMYTDTGENDDEN